MRLEGSVISVRDGSGSGEDEGDADREGSDRAPSTFGERLRASKDGDEEQSEEEKEKLTEQEGEFRSSRWPVQNVERVFSDHR